MLNQYSWRAEEQRGRCGRFIHGTSLLNQYSWRAEEQRGRRGRSTYETSASDRGCWRAGELGSWGSSMPELRKCQPAREIQSIYSRGYYSRRSRYKYATTKDELSPISKYGTTECGATASYLFRLCIGLLLAVLSCYHVPEVLLSL